MYRTVILLHALMRCVSSAPQSSLEPIEIIADVKPTTYDMPFSVYDVPPPLPVQQAAINDDSLDSNLEDFPFDITTENAVDLAKYDVATDNYDAITETPQTYGINMKNPKFYSKLGYFLRPHVMADALNNNGDPITYFNVNSETIKEKANDFETNTTRHDDVFQENDDNKTVNTDDAVIQSGAKNKTGSVENKPSIIGNKSSNVENKSNSVENDPSRDQNKRGNGEIEKNIVEIDENSIEIKTESGEFKSNKIVFQPKYVNMRRKGNTARQTSKSAQREFRSKCRCEKIWNCPRLQITVPRCPNEYFMCCF